MTTNVKKSPFSSSVRKGGSKRTATDGFKPTLLIPQGPKIRPMDVFVPMSPFSTGSKLMNDLLHNVAIPALGCAFSIWRDNLLQTFIEDSRFLTGPELKIMHWILDILDDR